MIDVILGLATEKRSSNATGRNDGRQHCRSSNDCPEPTDYLSWGGHYLCCFVMVQLHVG